MPNDHSHDENNEKGRRAEAVASWYLRLNGFLAIENFIVHLDRYNKGTARTEADFIAVRFPYSREFIQGRGLMEDDPRLIKSDGRKITKPLFVLVEVKAGRCGMNGPWTNRQEKNMQRVIRRMGFAEPEKADEIAEALYNNAKWEGKNYIVQYICIGRYENPEIQKYHINLLQITFADIGKFLRKRHYDFPEKTPDGFIHDQWPEFGRHFGNWFWNNKNGDAAEAVQRYIDQGPEPGL